MNSTTKKVPLKLTISVIAACLISFCGLLTETAINIAFPSIMNDLSITTATVQWLTTGNLLVVAMVTPLSSFLQKRFQLKSLFCFSAICFLVGSVLALFAPNFTVLLVARLIHGVATGIGVPIAFSIILGQIPHHKTGTYMGFGALVSAAAPAFGPTFGGIVNSTIGWRNIFSVLIPILVFTLILGILTIQKVGKPEKTPIDMPGVLLVMGTFFCLVYGFANLATITSNLLSEALLFIVGILCLVLFVRHSMRAKHPLIDVRIFTNRPFVCHLFAFFLINAIMLGTSFLLPNYLQVVLAVISMSAGFLLLPGAALNACMGPISGGVLDKHGPAFPIIAGSTVMVAGIALMTVFGTNLSPIMIAIFYVIFGVGCGFAFGNTMTTGMMALPPEQKTFGNTSFNTLMQFAGAVGTCVTAACVSLTQSTATAEQYQAKTALGSTYGFVFLLALAVIALVLQVVGIKVRSSQKEPSMVQKPEQGSEPIPPCDAPAI